MTKDNILTYLGIVRWTVPEGYPRGPYTQLEPLYEIESNENNERYIEDSKTEFPNRGLISWFKPIEIPAKDTLWYFSAEEQSSFERDNPDHDAFKVTGIPSPVNEFIDLSDDNLDVIRNQLTNEGLFLPFIPSTRVYIKLHNGICVGPIKVSKLRDSEGWVMKDIELTRIPLADPICSENLVTWTIDGKKRVFLFPLSKYVKPIGYQDWSSDSDILKRTLKWIRHIDPEYTNQLGLVNKVIEHAVEKIIYQDEKSSDVALIHQRLDRAKTIVSGLNAQTELLTEIRNDILALPEITADKEKILTEAKREADDDRKRSLDLLNEELEKLRTNALEQTNQREAEARQTLQSVQQQTEILKKEISILENEKEQKTIALKAELNSQIENLDQNLKDRLSNIVQSPTSLLSDVLILKAILGIDAQRPQPINAQRFDFNPVIKPLPDDFENIETKRISGLDQLRKQLRSAFKSSGLSIKVAGALQSAFQSGVMPILFGDKALNTLEAYSSCIAGKRLLWLPISPVTLEPSDLFGRVDSVTGNFIPGPGGLSELFLMARETKDIWLVVLDGLNRAPIDSYLEPILTCYSGGRNGNELRSLALFNPNNAQRENRYSSLGRTTWPRNILLAGIWREGIVLPTPRSLWNSSALINLDIYDSGTDEVSQSTITAPKDLAYTQLEDWQEWYKDSLSNNKSQFEKFMEALTDKLIISKSCQEVSTSFYQSAQLWFAGEADMSLRETIRCCVIPQVISTNQEEAFRAVIEEICKQFSDRELFEEPEEKTLRFVKELLL